MARSMLAGFKLRSWGLWRS